MIRGRRVQGLEVEFTKCQRLNWSGLCSEASGAVPLPWVGDHGSAGRVQKPLALSHPASCASLPAAVPSLSFRNEALV